jgi:hypothetical protein
MKAIISRVFSGTAAFCLKCLPDKCQLTHYAKTLKFALYTAIHPLDGFWDLTRENRGSLAAAHTITALLVAVEIMRITLTNFQFIDINLQSFNIVIVILRVLLPLGLWTVANWSLTTLMDGKGKMSEIYMATAYAMTPYVIINAAMILLSHFITVQEGAVYYFFLGLAGLWSVFLILVAMMMIHDYSAFRAIFSSLLAIIGMGVMVFLFLMFFSLISDTFAYFLSIFREIIFRIT